MNEDFLTIREMGETFGVSARTLRFYEAKELLAPRRVGQKRLFTRRDRARMRLILEGRKFGLALEEIRQLLNLYDEGPDGPRRQLQRALQVGARRLAEMEAERAELDRLTRELRERLNSLRKQLEAERQDAA